MDLATAWSDERHANGKPRLNRIPGWRAHGVQWIYNVSISQCPGFGKIASRL